MTDKLIMESTANGFNQWSATKKAFEAIDGLEVGSGRAKSYWHKLDAIDVGKILAKLNEAGLEVVEKK